MKKRISLILVVAMLLTLLVPLTVTTVSAETPVLITDQASFVSAIATNSVKDSDGKATGTFKLANDITISGEWDFTTAFRGELDGNGHTITFANGATVKGGLFQMVGANAYIHDLKIAQQGTVTWVLQTAPGCENACLGGVVGLSGAGAVNGVNSWGVESFVSSSANKVRFENITVTVNMDVTGSSVNASVGGIVGEIGIYTEITNCTFNGYISDATNRYNSGTKDSYCKDMVGATVRSAYGGMVGVGFRKAVMIISDCTNNGNITGYGQEGGILGTVNNAWDDLIKTVTIQRCINNGIITCRGTETKSNVGGIAGFVFLKDGSTATVSNCINFGKIQASGSARSAGIVGDLRRGAANAFQIIGCLQECSSFTGSQIAQANYGSGTVAFIDNYGLAGAGGSVYTLISDASGYEAVCTALNATYSDVYKMDTNYGTITLSWAHVHSFGAWIIDQAGSCVKADIKHRVCSTCSYVEEAVTPAPGHNFVSGTCSVCSTKEVAGGIYSQADLAAMDADGDYTLQNDITISGEWSYATPFTGSLDGQGYTITFAKGATVIGGLFKQLNQGATVKNLNIVAENGVTWKTVADAEGSGSPCVGGVAASAQAGYIDGVSKWGDVSFVTNPDNIITIQNVTVTANIAISGTVARSGKDENKVAAGGMVGELGIISLIKNCTFNGSISDENRTKADSGRLESGYGGMVGVAIRSGGPVQIVECINNGSITGYGQEGGILGYSRAWGEGGTGLDSLVIESCINNGSISCLGTGTNASVGGIAGYIYVRDGKTAIIRYCINTGTVTRVSGDARRGGILGDMRRGADNAVQFIGCLQESANVAGNQIATTSDGSGNPKYENVYAYTAVSGQATAAYDATTFASAFETLNAAYPGIYAMQSGKVTLAFVSVAVGSKINSQSDLAAMSADGDYTLEKDITISGTWDYSATFTGTFDGKGHTITIADGATIIGGLFEQLSSKAVIKDLNIVQAGSATYTPVTPGGSGGYCVGVLAASIEIPDDCNNVDKTANAENTVTIQNVTVTANITSITTKDNNKGYAVGGIVGEIGMITLIENCTFNGSITDVSRTKVDNNKYESGYAGIVGQLIRNGGTLTINQCINNGDITGYGAEGGILGHAREWSGGATAPLAVTIEQCINNGTIKSLGTDTKSNVGGIAGYVYVKDTSTAMIRNCINTGAIVKSGTAYGGGMVGCLRRGPETFSIIGCLQDSTENDGTQMATAQNGSGDLICENNYSVAGTSGSMYTRISNATEYAAAFTTLNAAYPGVFRTFNDKITLKFAVPEGAHEHSWGAWITDQAAGCTTTGSKHRTCSGCSETQVETIPAAGHNYVSGTCTECGKKEGFIYDQSDLAAMSATGSYTLANNITISGTWNYTTVFTGTFNGAGYTITFANGATIIGGLFQQLSSKATVKNLNIVQAGTATYTPIAPDGSGAWCVGVLVASIEVPDDCNNVDKTANADNIVTIRNVTVTANVTSITTKDNNKGYAVGGIAGEIGMITSIWDCTFNGSISDQNRSYVTMNAYESGYAGIVGVAIRNGGPLRIVNCTNNGSITGYGQEAGILGYSRAWGGGATGLNALVIEDCVNNGAITCLQTELGTAGNNKRATAGGIAGYIYAGTEKTAIIQNNVNYGNVTSAGGELAMSAGIVARVHKGLVVIMSNVNNGNISTAEGGLTDDIVVLVEGSSGFVVNENDGTTQAGSIAAIQGYQMTDVVGESRNIRFVASIGNDLTAAEKVGIEIRVYTGDEYKTAKGDTTGVYESVYADGKQVTAAELGAGYLYTAILNNVPTDLGTVRVLVRTYHVVSGVTHYSNYTLATLDLAD